MQEIPIASRLLLTLLLLGGALHALTLDLRRGLEKNRPFAVLHLRDEQPFLCTAFYDERGEPSLFECAFDRMPSTPLKPVESDFFTIRFKTADGKFLVRILPKKRSLLHPLPPPIHERPILPVRPPERSAHWIVLGYETEPPYLGPERAFDEGLAFPLDLNDSATPTVGALDIDGRPVFMQDNRDVEKFLAIKEAFRAGKYKKAYDLATDAMELYPNSIFASDFLRYRIKALMHLDMKENADEIIRLGKIFIKKYASDEYLPEVLLLLARIYSATGFVSDANYFFNRLIEEHKGTRYANLGLIYLGDQLYINGKSKEAMASYMEAYYNAKDLDVASLAAYKLALRYMDQGKTKKAVEFLRKIWKRNPDFLLKNKEDAHDIAKQLAARRVYDLAIAIDKALLKRLRKLDDLYETILFEIGEWYDEKGEVKQAIDWYERYLNEFAYGAYSDKAKKNLDALFVAGNDANATEALRKYETLMREYKGTAIADKALAAKAKLLVAQKRYDEALALKPLIEKIADAEAKKIAEEALKQAAKEAFEAAKGRHDCTKGVSLAENYGVGKESVAFLYGCYVDYARYDKALKLAKEGLKRAKNAEERALWSCRAGHALTRLGRYDEAKKALEDVRTLAKNPEKVCPSLPWDEVAVARGLGKYAETMEAIHRLAKTYGGDMRMAELYKAAADEAKKTGDTIQREWALKRLVALQNAKGSHPYSPWAEFELIRILKKQKRYAEALKVAEGLERLKLEGEKRARLLYEKGQLLRLLGKKAEAKRVFEECAKSPEGGAWKRLCREAATLE